MKRKEKIQLHTLSVSDLNHQVSEIVQKLKKMQLEKYTKPGKNVREAKKLRLTKAVLKTVIQEKRSDI